MQNLKQAFEGFSEPTKDALLRAENVRAELVKALTAVAKEPDMTPPCELIFQAFKLCPVENIKCVLVGQDPYIKRGEAMGLSFSVPHGVKIPPSLSNIYKMLVHQKEMQAMPTHGDLSYWARQGVLLLNTALTTRVGKSDAHTNIWAQYSSQVVKNIASHHPCAFILLGKQAQTLITWITESTFTHCIQTWSHPSPASTINNDTSQPQHIIHCPAFTRVNEWLVEQGQTRIDWNVDPQGAAYVAPREFIRIGVPKFEPSQLPPTIHADALLNDVPTPNDNNAPIVPINAPNPNNVISAAKLPHCVHILRKCTPHDPKPPTGNILYAFTDGGAKNNGKPNCTSSWAFYITDGYTMALASAITEPRDLGEIYNTSNQRAELSALMFALEYIETSSSFAYTEIIIVSDSKYSIQCIEQWAPRWREKAANAKPRAKPKPEALNMFAKYKNTDLIFPALDATMRIRERYHITFKHVNSHVDPPPATDKLGNFIHKGNHIVDGMCGVLL